MRLLMWSVTELKFWTGCTLSQSYSNCTVLTIFSYIPIKNENTSSVVSQFLEEAGDFCLPQNGQTESGCHRSSCLMAARGSLLLWYRGGHSTPPAAEVMDIMPVLCHTREWCVQVQLCLCNFMFGKHHIKNVQIYLLFNCWIWRLLKWRGANKKIGARVGKVVYVY
jgi:hypothetical protein